MALALQANPSMPLCRQTDKQRLKPALNWTGLFTFLILLIWQPAMASDEIRIMQVTDYQENEQLLFDSQTQFHLPQALIDAIYNEIPLTFETEIIFTEHQRLIGIKYDRERVNIRYQTQLSYSSFHNRYTLENQRNQNRQHFSSLNKALATLGTLAAFPVLSLSELHPGQKYTLKLRIRLNYWRLPAPMILNALFNPEWQLDSDWFETTLYTPKSWL
ncbi:DUF4390 domain-containing protein [Thiomicrorhabdus sp. zzn3]|uniref:DUF4390 domain-containing protein n=1 Tax=Thiomicrorhabdus sp. zzn3 TaxID=3039775 RepID=UPI002436E228|nr:DUF4390 domain-containing protein [Thiomicrorhabdus sp. zzn3]MDG6778941.1 DUF4390 domain-containing protein [Thiomicrorhabdus sp. zzn3]